MSRSRSKVLVVDDDKGVRAYLSEFFSSRDFEPACCESAEQAQSRLAGGYVPDLAILDVRMPGMSGLEVLDRIKQMNPSIPVIMLTVLGNVKHVVEAMRRGASDYLSKPFEDEELEIAIGNVLEKRQLRDEVKSLREKLESFGERDDILSSNRRMLRIKQIALQVADTDVPVLILGESGVGKEVVARFIHAQSGRRAKPFVKINCAALPRDLLESELFGYEKGAFTGALNEKPGKFELAHRGTLLLDEIGEMSPALQAKLLHVLQDGEFTRLGGRRSLQVDVRILASTNKPLDEAMAKGEFREDLYFRLNVIKLDIPPLRERKEDITLLCSYFFRKYAEKYAASMDGLPPELMRAFLAYHWPGNVRQIENAIKRFLIVPDLQMSLAELTPATPDDEPLPRGDVSLKDVAAQAAEETEKAMVRRVLEETRWNRKEAARRLRISYKALLNKLKKWRLDNRNDPKHLGLGG